MEYRVVNNFKGLDEDGKIFKKGEPFDAKGIKKERLNFLLNPIAELNDKAAIEVVEEEKKILEPQLNHVGGGWYELSNGERVKGKPAAIEAEGKING